MSGFGILTRSRAFATATQAFKVVNNVAKQQFVVTLNEASATLDYEKTGNKIKFISTDVPPVFQGKGVGKVLAKHAFDEALSNKYEVTVQCNFLAKYYQDNIVKYKSLKIKMDIQH